MYSPCLWWGAQIRNGKRCVQQNHHNSFSSKVSWSPKEIKQFDDVVRQHPQLKKCGSLISTQDAVNIVKENTKEVITILQCCDDILQCCDDTLPSSEDTTLRLRQVQKQQGGVDCGLCAIANAIIVSRGRDPTKFKYDQSQMWKHLFRCPTQKKNCRFSCFTSST